MIVANQEILDEVEAFGFKLALVQSTMWSPTRTELKYKLIATNLNDELVAEWEFPSESKAEVAFGEYCSHAGI